MYKFTLAEAYEIYHTSLLGIDISHEFLKISSGIITIPAGYSWNGCTFAFDFKSTYYPSLVHDAFYQYKVNRQIADRIFYDMMKQAGFKLAFVYYVGVRAFGWLFF